MILEAEPVIGTPPDALIGVVVILVIGTLLLIAATWWDARGRSRRR